jgi:hypothetical protein
MAILAGMVAVEGLFTLEAQVDMSAQGFGAALLDGVHDLQVRGRHSIPVFFPVLGPMDTAAISTMRDLLLAV